MKYIFALLCVVFAFFACANDTSANPKNEKIFSSVVGWRNAGFTPFISVQRGGGLQKVVHSGNWLVLMDAWTSPVEENSETLTYSPRLFLSKIGTNVWDTLIPPTSAYIRSSSLYSDSSGVYVGTSKTGQIFKYNPEKKEWRELNFLKKEDSAWYFVFGIGKISNKLIVSIADYPDTLNLKEVNARILLQKDTGWQSLPTPPMRYDMYDDGKIVPLQFVSSVIVDKSLFVGTGDGIWKLDETTLSWSELPKFPKMKWNSNYHDVYEVQDLVAYKGSLVAVDGTNDRVYRWDGSNNWVALDSMIFPSVVRFNGDTSYNMYNSSLHDIKDLATDGKHLFISGDSPCPKVYMGDYGEPYGYIPKGWRAMNLGWCSEKGCVSKDATYSLDVVGDTIYAAAWEGLFKMPLSELDSAIAGQSDFNGFEKYQ